MPKRIPLSKEKINTFARALEANKIRSYKMILFGSWIKGQAKSYSDIDLAIISPNFGRDYFRENVLLRKIASAIDERIEPIAVSDKDINDRYSFLFSEIKKTGIKII